MCKCKLFFLLLFSTHANCQIIITVAGNGTLGLTGDGGMSTDAGIGSAGTVGFDRFGNYYIGEYPCTVREVSANNIINTVAGNGAVGYSGDSGLAINAQLNLPEVACDLNGNLIIADQGNNCIRRVDRSTGVITTIAGTGSAGFSGDNGLAISAQLSSPAFVTVSQSGELYISDGNNLRVRKVNNAGIITTVAGNGVGGFSGDGGQAISASIWPNGIRVDRLNNLYIANLQTVRKVDLSTGIITTIAGDSTVGYSGDGGPATSAKMWFAIDVDVDANGNIYVSESNNNVIRKIDGNGIINTIAGNGIAGFSNDNGEARNAQLNSPRGIALDTCGNLYVADNGNHRIRKVSFNPSCWPEATPTTNSTTPISIYPNPATMSLTITGSLSNVAIINMLGQTVYSHQYSNTTKTTIDISSLPTGVYFVKGNEGYVHKVVKE